MTSHTPAPSKKAFWIGWVLSALPIPLFLLSATMKFMMPPDVAAKNLELGWDPKYALALGIVELVSVILYLFPQTAVLGAVLLAGYLGGAIATHVRVGEPFYIPAAIGIVLWLGLYLREPRLRALIPLRH